jgi:6-phosphogluconolactonase
MLRSDGTVAVWPVSPVDGSLGECTDTKKQSSTFNPALADRQEAAHAHQVLLDTTEAWALVCDLGTDTVYVYAFDSDRGSLTGASNASRHLRLPEGSGPRHLSFHPSGKW